MAACNRRPRRQRPLLRARFVEAPVSSMKTSFIGSRSSCPANHSRRRFCTSARCCSSACAVFFNALIAMCVETSDKGSLDLGAKMKPSDFAGWLAALSSLSAAQRRIVFRELARAEADDLCEEGVEICEPRSAAADAKRAEERSDAVAATPSASGERDIFREIAKERYSRTGCPRCGALDVRPWGEARGLPRYRCVECRKTFNPFTGTPVAGLHNKDRWLDQARALIEGESLAKTAERCRIHPSTAFRWRHRFLAALNLDKPKSLSGIVEADETFILESLKGRRGGLARPARRRGGKAAKRGLSAEQIPVVVARD